MSKTQLVQNTTTPKPNVSKTPLVPVGNFSWNFRTGPLRTGVGTLQLLLRLIFNKHPQIKKLIKPNVVTFCFFPVSHKFRLSLKNSLLLHVCVLHPCSVFLDVNSIPSLLFDYMCMRLPFIPWSIARVSSRQALPGNLITTHHLCAFLLYLARHQDHTRCSAVLGT